MTRCPNHPCVFTAHASGICSDCRAKAEAGPEIILAQPAHEPPTDPWRNFIPAGMEPPQAMLPDTARAIMDLDFQLRDTHVCGDGNGACPMCNLPPIHVPYRKIERVRQDDPVPVRFSEVKADERAEGIARAVERLSQHEPRLGAAHWQAEV